MPPATDWKEVIRAGEAERFEEYGALLAAMHARKAAQAGLGRSLHTKANLGVEATFEVLGGLPPEAATGMFAAPRTYAAVARFSNGAGHVQSDRRPDVRGLAVKLFDVDGKKVIPGLEDARTQDF